MAAIAALPRAAAARRVLQEEVVEWIAGGVLGRDVQGCECVELVLHLRSRRHVKPHPPEDLDQFIDRLRNDVAAAHARRRARLGHIDARPLSLRARAHLRLALLESLLNLLAQLVSLLPESGLVRGRNLLEHPHEVLERPLRPST